MACSAAPMQIASLSGLVSIIAASHSVCQLKFRSDMAALPPEECRYLGAGSPFSAWKRRVAGAHGPALIRTSVHIIHVITQKSSGVCCRRERPLSDTELEPFRDEIVVRHVEHVGNSGVHLSLAVAAI